MWYYLSKVHLVKNDLVGVIDAEESSRKGEDGDYDQCELVVPFTGHRLIELIKSFLQGQIILIFTRRLFSFVFLTPMAQGRIGCRHGGGFDRRRGFDKGEMGTTV